MELRVGVDDHLQQAAKIHTFSNKQDTSRIFWGHSSNSVGEIMPEVQLIAKDGASIYKYSSN